MLLADASDHETAIVARRLTLDATGQAAVEALLVRALDIGQHVAVPVVSDDATDEKLILGTHTRHGIFKELGGMHVSVDGVAKLEEQSIFHVSGEFLPSLSVKSSEIMVVQFYIQI